MRYGQMRAFDIANGPGIRSSLFVVGCTHKCPGCFNEAYQDFNAGMPWTPEAQEQLLSYTEHDQVVGLSLLGGEPMQNTDGLIQLAQLFKERCPHKTLWIYSGYYFEELLERADALKLLSFTDVLVDGPFVKAKKDLRLAFRGSSNQRLLNIPLSLAQGRAILLDDF